MSAINARPLRYLIPLCAVLAPAAALAHPGHGAGAGFVAGLIHPLTGLDHVLMIVAVSAWAALLGPLHRVLVAACLAAFVAAGALLPYTAAAGAGLEAAIALTVAGSGMLLALGRRWPMWAAGLLAGSFALVHGIAHGAEGPANSALYVPGLAAATGTLALAVSFAAARWQAASGWWRAGGALTAAAGTAALFS
ncbi:MAG: HupE/UreJ family protein [Steroidobacteraceae bacterium]